VPDRLAAHTVRISAGTIVDDTTDAPVGPDTDAS
jgi:hypothetical protein